MFLFSQSALFYSIILTKGRLINKSVTHVREEDPIGPLSLSLTHTHTHKYTL